MNKSDFISTVAEKSGLTKADAKKAVDAFCETVTEVLKAGDKLALWPSSNPVLNWQMP